MNTAHGSRIFEITLRKFGEEITYNNEDMACVVVQQDKKILSSIKKPITLYDSFIYKEKEYIVNKHTLIGDAYNEYCYEPVLNYLTFKLKSGEIINKPCITKDVSTAIKSSSSILTLSSSVEVRIKRDDLTKLIKINDAFWIYNNVWKVTNVSWEEKGCYVISLDIIGKGSEDDETNRTTSTVYDYTPPVTPTYKTFTLSYGDNGTVTSNYIGSVLTGTDITLTFIPNDDYKVDEFTLNGTPITLTSNSYTFTLTDDTIANVTFTVAINRYNITYSCDSNGTLTIDKTSPIDEGEDLTFTYTPNDGYELDSFTVNGDLKTMTNNTYTIAVNQDINAIATSKEKVKEIVVTPSGSYGNGGTISSTGETYDYSIRKNQTAQFTFTVDGEADSIVINRTDTLDSTKATITITNNVLEIKALAESRTTLLSFEVVYGSTTKVFKVKLNALW